MQTTRLFLCGDVMLGRGIDQVLPYPGDATLHEGYVKRATAYVALAERAHGPIAAPVSFAYVWGDSLGEFEREQLSARIINLETSITTSTDFAMKGIHYKMNPRNIGALTVAKVDCCVLANNHVLDWGASGLEETFATLERANLRYAGAGRNAAQAAAPAQIPIPGGGRVLVFGFGLQSSGIPRSWGATESAPGVNLLSEVSERAIAGIEHHVDAVRKPGDLLVASLHWGGNWGYEIPHEQRVLAHALIDRAGFHIVHGHSSHHAKAIEIHRDRLILYGCGDFITDYEGITGYETFRSDLAVMYLPELATASGALVGMRMIPLQMRRLRLERATSADARWLHERLKVECDPIGVSVKLNDDDTLSL